MIYVHQISCHDLDGRNIVMTSAPCESLSTFLKRSILYCEVCLCFTPKFGNIKLTTFGHV